jgi:hypothetical protein
MTPEFDAAAPLARLHAAGVRHVVIGGVAVIAYGAQRYTKDLVCALEDLRQMKRTVGRPVALEDLSRLEQGHEQS